MPATDAQVQEYADVRIRPMAELFRLVDLRAADDKAVILDVYEHCEPGGPRTWEDNRNDAPPNLLTCDDVLVYNTVITLWAKFRAGTATAQDVTEFAAVWPIFQQACVRPVNIER